MHGILPLVRVVTTVVAIGIVVVVLVVVVVDVLNVKIDVVSAVDVGAVVVVGGIVLVLTCPGVEFVIVVVRNMVVGDGKTPLTLYAGCFNCCRMVVLLLLVAAVLLSLVVRRPCRQGQPQSRRLRCHPIGAGRPYTASTSSFIDNARCGMIVVVVVAVVIVRETRHGWRRRRG